MIERTVTTVGERAADGRTSVVRQYVTRKLKRRALRRHRWTPDQAAVSVMWANDPQTLAKGVPIHQARPVAHAKGLPYPEYEHGPVASREIRRGAGAEDRSRQWRKTNGG